MKVLDLFSGIGGFSLGLERAGFKTVAFCECEPYCRAVLKKHWPDVPCYPDVRELTATQLATDGIRADVICGGFPCQDLSLAGKGAGLAGARSGLWREFARLIDEVRPQYAIVENVAGLLSRGLGRVLGDLAKIGFDAEWHCIPAAYVGAPHRRDRVWIIAYPGRDEWGRIQSERRSDQRDANITRNGAEGIASDVADSDRNDGTAWRPSDARQSAGGRDIDRSGECADLANPDSAWQQQSGRNISKGRGWASDGRKDVADAVSSRLQDNCGSAETPEGPRERTIIASRWAVRTYESWWSSEPNVGRVAYGIPSRVDRLSSLGNAVVPQIPEIIGRAIMRHASNKAVQAGVEDRQIDASSELLCK